MKIKDIIYREDAINLCEKWRNRTSEHHDKNGWYIADTILKAIKELPSADRPQGEWKNYKDEHYCTNCGEVVICDWYTEDEWYDFCPNCGARMKGAER